MDKQTSQSGPQTNPNAVDHLITAFVEITSATTDEALFFLESHNFDLDAAVSTFLESTGPDDVAVAPFSTAAVSGDPISASPSPVESSPSASLSPSRSRSPSPASRSHYNLRGRKQQPASGSGSGSAAGKRVGGIRTFADLNRNDGEGSDSDSDQPQEYYTGGQKSGMLVQDPRRDNNVDNIFDQARQFATDGPQPSSSSMRFTGRGRLLSGETVSAPLDQQPQTIVHTVTFWQNGFTVNDGPLRGLDDPENASFLESIRKSECPRELDPPTRSIEVRVNLVRKEQNCPEPKKPKQFFQGAGRTLGSSSGLIPSSSPAPKPTPTPFGSASLITAPTPSLGLVVDSNLPTTSIQLRLADGTRMVSRFNLNHTVGDIRAFIDASRRGTAGTYHLQTMGFPPKQLTDLDQTIEQAGLASSVIIQRL